MEFPMLQVSREVEVKNLSKEQFIADMSSDLFKAKAEFEANAIVEAAERWSKAVDNMRADLTEKANALYKRESTRKQYFEKWYNAWIEKYKDAYIYQPVKLDAVRWSIEPWNNGGSIYIHTDDRMYDDLALVYDKSVNNKYFKACLGWDIRVTQFSHEIKLILTKEMQDEWADDEYKLCKAINDFYKNTTYWGD